MNKRLIQLDSLRGLAAITVVAGHFINMFPSMINGAYDQYGNWLMILIKYTPLHIFWAGHEAVMFFFVLSGFVLSIPFLKESYCVPYRIYLIKRICRIYIPYFVCLMIAVLSNILFYKGSNPSLTGMFNMIGQEHTDIGLVFQHILLIGSFPNFKFNPVLWSLVQEMRISILFPFLMYFVVKFNWKTMLVGGIILSFCAIHIDNMFQQKFQLSVDYFVTFHYIGMFIVGALLAKHRVKLIELIKKMKKWVTVILTILVICIYTYYWWFNYVGFLKNSFLNNEFVNDWVVTLSVSFFVILSLASEKVTVFLEYKPVHFIGKISYSLYLFHMVCLVTVINLLFGFIPFLWILVIAFILIIAISSLSYYFVEEPSIKLGKYFESKIKPKEKHS